MIIIVCAAYFRILIIILFKPHLDIRTIGLSSHSLQLQLAAGETALREALKLDRSNRFWLQVALAL